MSLVEFFGRALFFVFAICPFSLYLYILYVMRLVFFIILLV
jgi:hypothetical protein